MKTNVIMKIAIVFMAAFGAYAFSGNANANEQSQFYVHEGNMCRSILTSECTIDGDFVCSINVDNQNLQVWSDFNCTIPTYFKKD